MDSRLALRLPALLLPWPAHGPLALEMAVKDLYRKHRRLLRRGPVEMAVRVADQARPLHPPNVVSMSTPDGKDIKETVSIYDRGKFELGMDTGQPFFCRVFRRNRKGSAFVERGQIARRLELFTARAAK